MDKLKNFIDANRDAFKEDEMLPEGHFERFRAKAAEATEKPCGPIQPIGLCHSCLYRFVALIPLAGRDGLPEPAQKTTAQTCETQEEIEELRYITICK